MGQYLVRRLLQAIPLLILTSILVFLLIHALPGGPEAVYDNPNLDAAGRQALRASFGVDQPLPVQYIKWAGNVLIGNFGSSFATSQSVGQVIWQHFPPTLELFVCSFVMAFILTILLVQTHER